MSARVLAVLVHAVWVLLVVGLVALLLSSVVLLLKLVLAGLLAALAWQVRPRPVALPAGTALERPQSPRLFALLDRVAAATGTRAPARVVVDTTARASSGRAGGGTYVSVGLPLWSSAGPEARVATLAEQLGRLASGASIVDPLVVSASQSLADWQYFVTPTSNHRRRLTETATHRDPLTALHVRPDAGQSWLLEVLLTVLLLPFYCTVTLLRRRLHRLARRDLQVGQDRGLAAAVQVAGTDAMTLLSRTAALAQTAQVHMETASRRDAHAELWEIGAQQRLAAADVPLLSAAASEAIDEELRPLLRRTEQDLRDAARA